MFYKDWRKRLNHKIGQQIFLEAHKDYLTGDIRRKTRSLYVAYGIAAAVIITPYLMMLIGIRVLILDFPNLALIIIGIVIAGSGWMMLPPRMGNTERTYRRDDLPATFAFLDVVAKQVAAQHIDGIHINAEMNGYMAEFGRGGAKERVLGLGLVLWDSATSEQRVAFIAHEMAHQINNDPARSRIISMALHTLEQWYLLFSTGRIIHYEDDYSGAETMAEMLLAIPRLGVELIWIGLEKLNFAQHQRAEYFADAKAAEIAGAEAMIGLLENLTLVPILDQELAGIHPFGNQSGTEVMQQLARSISDAPQDRREKLLRAMRQEGSAVDSSHPPTAFRIEFLQLLGDRPKDTLPVQVDFEIMQSELAGIRQEIGADIISEKEVQ